MSPRKKSKADLQKEITDTNGRMTHAPGSTEEWAEVVDGSEPPDHHEASTENKTLTINQVVAYNVQRTRKSRGWSQEDLGRELTRLTNRKWSTASVSAAESSWRGGRVRRFDANELVAFSRIFGLPVGQFLLPPDGDEFNEASFVVDTLDEIGLPLLTRQELLTAVWDPDLPEAFTERLRLEFSAIGVHWNRPAEGVLKLDTDSYPLLLQAMREARLSDSLHADEGPEQ